MCLGTVGTVTAVWDEGGLPMARVRADSGERTACLLYTPGVSEGTHVLVHLGFAVEVLQPEAAREAEVLRARSDGTPAPGKGGVEPWQW